MLLAFAGTFLWDRRRPMPAFLVALGFSAAPFSQIAAAYVSAKLSAAVDSTGGISLVMHKYQGWEWITRDLGPIGVWVAAAGFLSHSLRRHSHHIT